MTFRTFFVGAVVALALIGCTTDEPALGGSGGGQAEAQPIREITQIAGDLYRFRNNGHYSVFLVTQEGIIATDPINEAAATWLKAELDQRFGVPVRYVIYSHHHGDHASGGDVFADTATFIGNESMPAAIASGGARTAGVRQPDETFTNRMTVELGGQTVELYYLGPNHTDNMTVMLFPEERVVFAVDFVTVRRLPFRTLRDSFLPEWIVSIERLEALDFAILAPGHGPLGTKQDAADHRRYLEDLSAAVAQGIAEGTALAELQETILLEDYSDWGQYEAWRAENIAGAYRLLGGAAQ